jgi:hypothetical protein
MRIIHRIAPAPLLEALVAGIVERLDRPLLIGQARAVGPTCAGGKGERGDCTERHDPGGTSERGQDGGLRLHVQGGLFVEICFTV